MDATPTHTHLTTYPAQENPTSTKPVGNYPPSRQTNISAHRLNVYE
jgi:hypothetical protein